MEKIYNSFLIRCWLLRSAAQADRAVFEIEHIQTGERQRVTSVAEMETWLLAALSPESAAAQNTSLAPGRTPEGKNDN